MDNTPIFSGRLLLAFIGFAVCTFALSIYLVGRNDYGADRHGPSSYAVSALGYAGIAEVLRELGVPVAKSRRNPAADAKGGVLVIAEPDVDLLPQMILPILPPAEKILLVLPKWGGDTDKENPRWIRRAYPLVSFRAERVLRLVDEQPKMERPETIEGLSLNEIGVAPELPKYPQFIKSDVLRPIVAAGDRILLGELRKDGRVIWVLSDPDLIANHAFTPEGKGAAFAVSLIQKLRGGGPVIFDETVHGFQSRPAAALRLLLQFPYSIITIQVVIGAILLLWATMGRFGSPDALPPTLTAGKAGLIANVAELMEFAGHERLIIQRYVENTIRDTARQLRAPKNLSYPQTLEWLIRLGRRRGITADCVAIARRADDLARKGGHADVAKFVETARDIHQWRQEILHGSSAHTRHH